MSTDLTRLGFLRMKVCHSLSVPSDISFRFRPQSDVEHTTHNVTRKQTLPERTHKLNMNTPLISRLNMTFRYFLFQTLRKYTTLKIATSLLLLFWRL